MSAKKLITVVIPTFNRLSLLKRLLDSLEQQSLSSNLFDIFIVDDGSTDATPSFLREKSLPAVSISRAGPAYARNTGAKHTKSDIIAFIDDDTIADKDWLLSVYNAYKDGVFTCAVEGDIISTGDPLPMTHIISHSGGGAYLTCNLAVRRECFEEAGGFNEKFKFNNEDYEFCLRLKTKGTIHYLPGMKVYHPVRPLSFPHLIVNSFNFSRQYIHAEYQLMELNPDGYKTVKFCASARDTIHRLSVRYTLTQASRFRKYIFRHPIRFFMWVLVCLLRQSAFVFYRISGYKGENFELSND